MAKIKKIKVLSDSLIETLMDCHERQLMNQEPRLLSDTKSVGKLIQLNLLASKSYRTKNDKIVMCLFISQAGIEYLNNLI